MRAIVPIVSRLSASGFTPARGITPKLGLKPTTPQNEAGRITDPAVCVPRASGTMPSATAAAEPLDDPPGVCAGLRGLAVLPGGEAGKFGGDRLAEDDRAGRPRQRDAGRVGGRAVALVDRRAVAGRHIDGVDQILDRDRNAVQRPAGRRCIAVPGRGKRRLAVEMMPGADHRLARRDPLEAGDDERRGAEPAGGDLPRGITGGEGERIGHDGLRAG